MNAPKSLLALCAVATFGLSALGQDAPTVDVPVALAPAATNNAQVPVALAVLVPDDAIAFGMTQAISQLEGVAADIAREVMPEMAEMMNADMLLGMALPPGFDVTAIDRERPFGFAVGPLSMESEPQVFVLVPTNNPDAIKSLLPTEGEVYSTRVSGGYLGITRGPNYPMGTGKCSLLSGLPSGVVSLSVDLETIFETFGPMIEFGMQMGRMQMETAIAEIPEADMGVDMSALMDGYFGMAESAIDSLTGLKLSVAVEETLVDFRWQMLVSEGSPMAQVSQGTPTDVATFLPLLSDDSLSFAMGADMGALLDQIRPFLDMAAAAYPEGMAEGLDASLDAWKNTYGLFGTAMAFSGGFTDEGMRMAGYFDGAHFDELLVRYSSIVREPFLETLGMHYVDMQQAKLGETELTRFTFDFDVAAILGESGEGADAEQVAMLQSMMQAIYGDRLVMTLAKTGDLGVLAVGGDDAYFTKVLGRAKQPGRLTPDIARLTSLAATANPFLAYRFDIGQLITQMGSVMETSMGIPPSGLEMFTGTSLPLSMYVGVTPLEWTGGLMVDVVQAREFAQLIQTAGDL